MVFSGPCLYTQVFHQLDEEETEFKNALESGANLQAGPSTGEAQRPRSQTQIEQIQLLQTYQDRLETSKPQFMDTDDGYSSSDSNGGGKNRQLALSIDSNDFGESLPGSPAGALKSSFAKVNIDTDSESSSTGDSKV
eukprot:TRINITY_DN1897_c0_g1_i1.p1 TRINITY_DN1897_c0_g1~~TRINITY_DN1897_c0_g1_i1.p1  ORF type:complete len:137 (-),score=13.89 TRINITY_DN1897_c0_g1_i1:1-411(-)